MTKQGSAYDAVVVGSGPNGLAAAITVARAGKSVLVREAKATFGGGARSDALTLPGFVHDTCSAVHPLALASPFFRSLPLDQHGLEWIQPPVALAHPLDDGTAACLYRSLETTAASLGRDGAQYLKLMSPWVNRWPELIEECLQPLHLPRHPWLLASFGLSAVRSARGLIESRFREPWARGLMAGLAAHSFLPLTQAPSAAIGLMLAVAGHAVGWPFPRGGAQSLSNALVSYLRSLGGVVEVSSPVTSVDELPPARWYFFDLTPRQLLAIAPSHFSRGYARALQRFRYGPGSFKIDWALSGPLPWKAAACAEAGTVHLGGTLEELIVAEQAPWDGTCAEKPYVLLSQPSVFDPSRAPAGKHTLWAYCHVPRGSTFDMTDRLEAQIERFAPGFRSLVIGKRVSFPADLQAQNPNLVEGDICGGVTDFGQLFFRPAKRWNPYATSVPGWFICSASTPPGAGVHGMGGFLAAKSALARA